MLLALCLFVPTARASTEGARLKALDQAMSKIDGAYPFSRLFGGGLSLVTGLPTAVGGTLLLLDSSLAADEILVGMVTAGTGSVMAYDGFSRLSGKSSAEHVLSHYKSFPVGKSREYGDKDKLQYGEQALRTLSERAYWNRILRGLLDAVSAASYLYLYQKGDGAGGKEIYPQLLAPGVALAAIGAYRLIFKSSEESAWDQFKAASQSGTRSHRTISVDLFALAIPQQPVIGARITF